MMAARHLLAQAMPPDGGDAAPAPDLIDPTLIDRIWAFLGSWPGMVILAAIVTIVVLRLWRGTVRAVKRRRPVRLNPRLAMYGNVGVNVLSDQQRKLARSVTATSSGASIVGYQITEQVEAVFVDGLPNPADALEALKSAAAARGANALINVHQDRSPNRRFCASGDAVIARKISQKPDAARRATGDDSTEDEGSTP